MRDSVRRALIAATVSKMAGHSSVSLTSKADRHVFEKPPREAAETMGRILGSGA